LPCRGDPDVQCMNVDLGPARSSSMRNAETERREERR
jgi:hypothetical protein